MRCKKGEDYQHPIGNFLAPGSADNLTDHLNHQAETDGSLQLEMFGRFMSGVWSAWYSCGRHVFLGSTEQAYGMTHISGLAQATVDQPIVSTLVPRSYFDDAFYYSVVAAVVSRISTLLRNTGPKDDPFSCAAVLGH